MTSERDDKGHGERDTKGQAPGAENAKEVFYYKDSGIQEKSGQVPIWLWAVFVALLIWGAYDMVTYWTPPPS